MRKRRNRREWETLFLTDDTDGLTLNKLIDNARVSGHSPTVSIYDSSNYYTEQLDGSYRTVSINARIRTINGRKSDYMNRYITKMRGR